MYLRFYYCSQIWRPLSVTFMVRQADRTEETEKKLTFDTLMVGIWLTTFIRCSQRRGVRLFL